MAIPPEGRALLDTIASTESPGYNVLYGGGKFSSYAAHPNQKILIKSGPNAGKYSSAAGKYQFLNSTWQEAAKALGLKDFSPESQDAAAWWLAQKDYKAATGKDLVTVLQSGDPAALAEVGQVLSGTWTSLPGGIEATTNTSRFAKAYADALGQPSTALDAIDALDPRETGIASAYAEGSPKLTTQAVTQALLGASGGSRSSPAMSMTPTLGMKDGQPDAASSIVPRLIPTEAFEAARQTASLPMTATDPLIAALLQPKADPPPMSYAGQDRATPVTPTVPYYGQGSSAVPYTPLPAPEPLSPAPLVPGQTYAGQEGGNVITSPYQPTPSAPYSGSRVAAPQVTIGYINGKPVEIGKSYPKTHGGSVVYKLGPDGKTAVVDTKATTYPPAFLGGKGTIVGGVVGDALKSGGAAVTEALTGTGQAVGSTLNSAKDTALDAGSDAIGWLGGLFSGGGSSSAAPAFDYSTFYKSSVPAASSSQAAVAKALTSAPMSYAGQDTYKAPVAAPATPTVSAYSSGYGAGDYGYTPITPAPIDLMAPPPLVDVPVAPAPAPVAQQPLKQIKVAPVPPPVWMTTTATGKSVPVGSITATGSTVLADGSIKSKYGHILSGPSKPVGSKAAYDMATAKFYAGVPKSIM